MKNPTWLLMKAPPGRFAPADGLSVDANPLLHLVGRRLQRDAERADPVAPGLLERGQASSRPAEGRVGLLLRPRDDGNVVDLGVLAAFQENRSCVHIFGIISNACRI